MSDFFIGFDRHPETPPAEGEPAPSLHLKPDTLLRHMMALGSSGSGKTVLCKVLTEEMVRNGLPAICIDPQGDLCSLAMNADKLKPGERCASTSNRNFEGRQGPGGRTHLVSPQVAAATAVAGHLAEPNDLPAPSELVEV